MKNLHSALIAAALLLGGATIACAQGEIAFLTPQPLKASLDKLIPGFEAKTGYKVKMTVGSGLGTKQQVARGEPFDVPIILPPYQEALASGNVVTSSATTLASLIMAVGVRKEAPKPDISTPDAVKRTLLAAKSISYVDPTIGSAGLPVVEMLKKLGLTEQLQPKIKIGMTGGVVQNLVAKGEAEICLLYLSDIRNPGIDVVGPVPQQIATPTNLVGFVSTHAKDPAAAKALLDYLTSPDAEKVYKAEGMQPR
ncbi:MAG TPA: molybdate ABC transporter substrate-binding protein [Bryobacteraceae bacterium]|nr:molybdate ABC transporter substrate-binding protein [Bryobacteraceae bacterium]